MCVWRLRVCALVRVVCVLCSSRACARVCVRAFFFALQSSRFVIKIIASLCLCACARMCASACLRAYVRAVCASCAWVRACV